MSKPSRNGLPNGPIYEPYDRYWSQNVDRNWSKENLFFYRLTEIAVSRFIWVNVPPEIDTRYLEMALHNNGVVAFWYDDHTVTKDAYYKYFAVAASPSGQTNYYNNYTEWTVAASGFLSRKIPARLCEPIWSSFMRMPDCMYIHQYAERLTRIDSVIQTNIDTQRHPFVVAVDEDERHTFQNAYRSIQSGEPVIWGTQALSPGLLSEKIQVFNTQVPSQQVLDMLTAKARIWNECMTFMGVENANTDKKERMISNEVASNDGQIQRFRKAALVPRQDACERINRKFGLNMWVEWNEEISVPEVEEAELGGF